MIFWKRFYRILFIVFLSFFFGIIFSHYLEQLETPFLFKIRNVIYFGSKEDRTVTENSVVLRKYKGEDKYFFNPVNHIQSVWGEINYILANNIDSAYFRTVYNYDIKVKVDTANLIFCSQNLLKFVDTLIVADSTICFRLSYNFPETAYNIKPNWHSGMAQGHAAMLMLACYFVTDDSSYLSNAEKFINLLDVLIRDGGVKENVSGGIWFEEYAQFDEVRPSPLVLNGHIFAIDGLYAVQMVTKKEIYYKILLNSISAIENNITKYIIFNYWSYYDQFKPPRIANATYHKIHIDQLNRMIYLRNKYIIYDNNQLSDLIETKNKFIIGKLVPVGIFVRLIYSHNLMLLTLISFNAIVLLIIWTMIKLIKRKIKPYA